MKKIPKFNLNKNKIKKMNQKKPDTLEINYYIGNNKVQIE